MKRNYQISLIIFILIFSLNVKSQTNTPVTILDNDEYETSIIEFSACQIQNKTYLKWKVNSLKSDCSFLILRSYNKFDFEIAGIKNGYKTKKEIPLMFCFIDSIPLAQSVYYKIKVLNYDEFDSQEKLNNENIIYAPQAYKNNLENSGNLYQNSNKEPFTNKNNLSKIDKKE